MSTAQGREAAAAAREAVGLWLATKRQTQPLGGGGVATAGGVVKISWRSFFNGIIQNRRRSAVAPGAGMSRAYGCTGNREGCCRRRAHGSMPSTDAEPNADMSIELEASGNSEQ